MADMGNPSCPLLSTLHRSRKSVLSRYSFLPSLLCPPFHLSWKLLCSCYSCLHPLCSPPLLRLNSHNPYLLVHFLNYNFLLRCYCLLPVDLQAFCPAHLYFTLEVRARHFGDEVTVPSTVRLLYVKQCEMASKYRDFCF